MDIIKVLKHTNIARMGEIFYESRGAGLNQALFNYSAKCIMKYFGRLLKFYFYFLPFLFLFKN